MVCLGVPAAPKTGGERGGLLDAHLFRDVVEVNPSRLLKNVGDEGHRLGVLTGTLHTTYEYPFAGSIEYGFGSDPLQPRDEGQWFSALGRVAVVIHSEIADSIAPSDGLPKLLDKWDGAGINRVLVFSNASDAVRSTAFQPWNRAHQRVGLRN